MSEQTVAQTEIRGHPDYPGYDASDGGAWSRMVRVGLGRGVGCKWVIGTELNRKPLKSKRNRDGYRLIYMADRNGRRKNVMLHRFIWEAFNGPIPNGMHVCHNDGNPSDNRLANLRIDTPKGKAADKKRHGTWQGGEKAFGAKLTESDVFDIRSRRAAGEGMKSIADRYGVTRSNVGAIVRRKSWRHI